MKAVVFKVVDAPTEKQELLEALKLNVEEFNVWFAAKEQSGGPLTRLEKEVLLAYLTHLVASSR